MVEIVMPKLGLTMTEGTIQRWLKQEGDTVAAGEGILEIETDKSTATVEAPAGGILGGVRYAEAGTEVEVGATLAYLLEAGERAPVAVQAPERQEKTAEPAPVSAVAAAAPRGSICSSPAARKLAKDLGISLEEVQPDARGIIHLAQVQAYQEEMARRPKATPLAAAKARELGADLGALPNEGRRIRAAQVEAAGGLVPAAATPVKGQSAAAPDTENGDQVVPFTGVRKTVARRMTKSMQEVPHFYLSLSVDMSKTQALMARQTVKISLHDMLIRVLALALAENPTINAHVYDDRMVLKREINIGVAVAAENGLIVPVVRNVAGKSLKAIASESAGLVARARKGELRPDEYQGGTFTISNLGMFGIERFTAIVNQPEAAILAVGRTVDTPVVRDGEITIRPMLGLTVSYDHRAVDGAAGAKFLNRVKELLEDPELLI